MAASQLPMGLVAKIIIMPRHKPDDQEAVNHPRVEPADVEEEEQAGAAKVEDWLQIGDRLLGNKKNPSKIA